MFSVTKHFSSLLAPLALIASALIATQIGYSFYAGDPFCMNEGCEIVEHLTTIPPLYFNGAGLFFFLTLYIAVKLANSGSRAMRYFVLTLLTAAMGAEGILIGFQYLIAQAWCSYCLIIFSFIALLNLIAGGAQFFRGAAVFLVVTAAFFSLNFGASPHGDTRSFKDGVLTTRIGDANTPEMYLFFSSACSHCENVIDTLALEPGLTVHFNPIDEVTELEIDNREPLQDYLPGANTAFLKTFGITKVPTLLLVSENKYQIISGEYAIMDEIDRLTGQQEVQSSTGADFSSQSSAVSPLQGLSEDGCSTGLEVGCEDGADIFLPESAPQFVQ